MISIEQLKEKYPEPYEAEAAPSPSNQGYYCVGGALCLELGQEMLDFPEDDELAIALREANPNLSMRDSYSYAEEIVLYNDEGRFEEAWETLRLALIA